MPLGYPISISDVVPLGLLSFTITTVVYHHDYRFPSRHLVQTLRFQTKHKSGLAIFLIVRPVNKNRQPLWRKCHCTPLRKRKCECSWHTPLCFHPELSISHHGLVVCYRGPMRGAAANQNGYGTQYPNQGPRVYSKQRTVAMTGQVTCLPCSAPVSIARTFI
jgi:hypothetical protein